MTECPHSWLFKTCKYCTSTPCSALGNYVAAVADLRDNVARALGWDNAEQWTAAMAQIDLGQKAIEQLVAADALADAVEMAESSIKWFAWPALAEALLAYRERRGRDAV